MAIFRARHWPSASRPVARPGFTLLELLAVMALLALVSAMAATKFSTSYRQAQVTTAIATFQSIDNQLRTLAVKHAAAYELRIDLEQHTLAISAANAHEKQVVRTYAVPAPLEIAAVRSPREDRSYGEAVIRCDAAGLCETYAIQLTTPTGSARWILFTGVTGQPLNDISDQHVEDLFRALRPTGSDAD